MSDVFYKMRSDHVVWMLAFIGGLYDAAGYFQLQGLFTSSITGNIVAACGSTVLSDAVVAKACVTVSFFLSAGFANALAIVCKKLVTKSSRQNCIILLIVYLILLVIVWIVGTIYEYHIHLAKIHNSPDDYFVVLVGCIMAAAMGVHNVTAKGKGTPVIINKSILRTVLMY